MYRITSYTVSQAHKYGVTVRMSAKKDKKIDVVKNGIVIASVGGLGYSDFPTYMKTHGAEYAKERRRLYRLRHSGDRNVKNSPGYWADRLLW